jgi:hypothetical protein
MCIVNTHPDEDQQKMGNSPWLNLVEVFFGTITRKALRGANYAYIEELTQAIQDFLKFTTKTLLLSFGVNEKSRVVS